MALRQQQQEERKRRVGKACDCCRIKKTKCDGKKPCSKCTADNKVCVYSERKRHRDRVHPSGYVELLEARLDLMSKSLEKLCHMIANKEDINLVKQEPGEEFNVNKVIQQLINNEGLLDEHHSEWDGSALYAAANFVPGDEEALIEASKKFLVPKKDVDTTPRLSTNYTVETSSVSSPDSEKLIEDDYPQPPQSDMDGFNYRYDLPVEDYPVDEDIKLDLGPFSSGAAIAAAAMEGGLTMSHFEKDSLLSPNDSPFESLDYVDPSSLSLLDQNDSLEMLPYSSTTSLSSSVPAHDMPPSSINRIKSIGHQRTHSSTSPITSPIFQAASLPMKSRSLITKPSSPIMRKRSNSFRNLDKVLPKLELSDGLWTAS